MTTNITLPELADGERYLCGVIDEDGTITHTILLPGDADPAPWAKQMEWAKSIGGDLPNRIEQAMLWANHRDQFQKDFYWSNEIHHAESGWAWFQLFFTGRQGLSHKDYELRARAVRRLVI